MPHKTENKHRSLVVPFEVKDIDEKKRTFRGLASTFDVDLGRDRFIPGCWKRTIEHFKAQTRRPRIIHLKDSHRTGSVFDILGHMVDMEETKDGLIIQPAITPTQKGDDFLAMVKHEDVGELSVGFYTVQAKEGEATVGGRAVRTRDILEAQLDEVSAVQRGMNPNTELLTLKAYLKQMDSLTLESFLEALAEVDTKTLLQADPQAPLNQEQMGLIKSLHNDTGALLSALEAKSGLAPEDPARLLLQKDFRDLIRRTLATR